MKHTDQLLVGSVSLPSAREVFSSCCDAIGDNLERIRIAEKYFPEFGTSYVCGFGRREDGATARLLARHHDVAEALKKAGS